MTLPYDISRCGNGIECPLRTTCARFLCEGHPTYQPYSMFEGGKDCTGFIDAKDYEVRP